MLAIIIHRRLSRERLLVMVIHHLFISIRRRIVKSIRIMIMSIIRYWLNRFRRISAQIKRKKIILILLLSYLIDILINLWLLLIILWLLGLNKLKSIFFGLLRWRIQNCFIRINFCFLWKIKLCSWFRLFFNKTKRVNLFWRFWW